MGKEIISLECQKDRGHMAEQALAGGGQGWGGVSHSYLCMAKT